MAKTDGLHGLLALLFAQMLPATLLVPAIRPLFADFHGGNEGAMHAFMSVNMLGAAVVAPLVAMWADRLASPHRLVAALAFIDALLLFAVSTAAPTPAVLVMRTLEGGAHVGAASILLARAVGIARARGTGRTMGMAGAAIVFAIVLGSALGGVLVELDTRAPFWAGAGLSTVVALVVLLPGAERSSLPRPRRVARLFGLMRECRELWVPISAAFVARFTIGCLVVTFALFAHRQHGISDGAIGWLFASMTLPFALATYPAGRLADHIPCTSVLVTGTLAYAVSLAGLGWVSSGALPVLMLTSGLASGMIFAAILCHAGRMSGPDNRTRAIALVNVAGCLGMVMGPMVAGIVSAVANRSGDPVAGYRSVFLVAAGSLLLWLVLSARWLVRRYRMEAGPRAACTSAR